ncbi:MAG TPA: hypothetical protein VD862_03160 [Candidatus Paceibacterota bacterium]|nr:hypothetical protein [Candidatus Paceibacterota bacterium]
MHRILLIPAVIMAAACGTNSPTSVDGIPQRDLQSALGFHINGGPYVADGGVVVQRHADLADAAWLALTRDLAAAGYRIADPRDIRGYVVVFLHTPHGRDSLIYDRDGNEVGGWYDYLGTRLHVPGDYVDPDGWLGLRPASQPLIHEMTHHWCYREFGHFCLAPDAKGNKTLHEWAMPDGNELWHIQWQNTPAASRALSSAFHCTFAGAE